MSDAMTDIAQDERRSVCYSRYLEAVSIFLEKPTDDNKKAAVEAAGKTDGVPGGYFGGRTSFADGVIELLEKLASGDKQVWAKFLASLKDNNYDFQILKKLSPFAGQLLVSVDYGCGFVRLYGDFEPLIAKIIEEDKGWKVYDADKYFMALPMLDAKKSEVFWIGCGASGPGIPKDHPRPGNAPPIFIGVFDDD
jgi:hypothetical protein